MHWFAPELFVSDDKMEASNQDVKQRGTTKSDVFVEGCLFGYILLDGKHPFGSDAEINDIQTNIVNGNFTNLKREQKLIIPIKFGFNIYNRHLL